jgi:acetyl esterase/lipase
VTRAHAVVFAAVLFAGAAAAAEAPPAIAPGSVPVPAFTAPFSVYASPPARDHAIAEIARHENPGDTIEARRAYYDRLNRERVTRMRKQFTVHLGTQTIGGVLVDVVEPAAGAAPRNKARVLISLHGGAFLWGARSGALVEAIPVAATMGIKVVAPDYRQGPEHEFPAASEDVEAVYRALLKDYKPQNIGIYGCSAGGYLTAQAVARFIKLGLPLPGAVGTFCGALLPPDGDSYYVAPALSGQTPPTRPPQAADYPYLRDADLHDPLVFPGFDADYVKRFPPTLLLSGTRDFTMSSVLASHARLDAAGVDAELHVWDGMWHAFFVDPELPESQQAYAVIARFFDRHLGGAR